MPSLRTILLWSRPLALTDTLWILLIAYVSLVVGELTPKAIEPAVSPFWL